MRQPFCLSLPLPTSAIAMPCSNSSITDRSSSSSNGVERSPSERVIKREGATKGGLECSLLPLWRHRGHSDERSAWSGSSGSGVVARLFMEPPICTPCALPAYHTHLHLCVTIGAYIHIRILVVLPCSCWNVEYLWSLGGAAICQNLYENLYSQTIPFNFLLPIHLLGFPPNVVCVLLFTWDGALLHSCHNGVYARRMNHGMPCNPACNAREGCDEWMSPMQSPFFKLPLQPRSCGLLVTHLLLCSEWWARNR